MYHKYYILILYVKHASLNIYPLIKNNSNQKYFISLKIILNHIDLLSISNALFWSLNLFIINSYNIQTLNTIIYLFIFIYITSLLYLSPSFTFSFIIFINCKFKSNLFINNYLFHNLYYNKCILFMFFMNKNIVLYNCYLNTY